RTGVSRRPRAGTMSTKSWPSAPRPCIQITARRGDGAVSISIASSRSSAMPRMLPQRWRVGPPEARHELPDLLGGVDHGRVGPHEPLRQRRDVSRPSVAGTGQAPVRDGGVALARLVDEQLGGVLAALGGGAPRLALARLGRTPVHDEPARQAALDRLIPAAHLRAGGPRAEAAAAQRARLRVAGR